MLASSSDDMEPGHSSYSEESEFDSGSTSPAETSGSSYHPSGGSGYESDSAPRINLKRGGRFRGRTPSQPRQRKQRIPDSNSSDTSSLSEVTEPLAAVASRAGKQLPLHENYFVEDDLAWYVTFPPVAHLARSAAMVDTSAGTARVEKQGEENVLGNGLRTTMQASMPGILADAIKQLGRDTGAGRVFKKNARSQKMIEAAARRAGPHELTFPRRQQNKQFAKAGGRPLVVLGGTHLHVLGG